MSGMQDIRTLIDLGQTVRAARQSAGVTTVEVARRSGRSRDVLHRLETGQDVSVSSLLSILSAIGHRAEVAPSTRPDVAEMQRRFAHLLDDESPAAAPSPQPPASPRRREPPRRRE
jgi:HTH-type transcriptional regulator / antitoxin HipB